MKHHDRTDFYRSNRDYASLLDDNEGDEEEEGDENHSKPRTSGKSFVKQHDPVTRERQEYLERRQKLKELERQKLKGKFSSDGKLNGRSTGIERVSGERKVHNALEKKRALPYDNYGSFFGPSEPVVARRIIEEARAKEKAILVPAKLARESPERRSVSKESSGFSRPAAISKPAEKVPPKVADEATLKIQRLKEARDYSFLFSDEEPPRYDQERKPADSESLDKERPRSTAAQGKKDLVPARKTPLPSKSSASGGDANLEMSKLQLSSKASSVFDKKPHSMNKTGKLISGPGRPFQASTSHGTSLANGKKKTGQSGTVKKTGTVTSTSSGSKIAKDYEKPRVSLGSSGSGVIAAVAAPHKSNPSGNTNQGRPSNDERRPAFMVHTEQRRLSQVAGPSKKLPQAKVSKDRPKLADARRDHRRAIESESEDSFLDDDDDGGGGDYRSLIRKMFGYNPNRYRDIDDEDDRDMEACFGDIQAEEKRSERIAREEDERELALIEAEERAERARKVAKRRKLKQR